MRETLPFFDCVIKIPFRLLYGADDFFNLSFSFAVSRNQASD